MSHTDPDSQVQNSTKRKEGRQLLGTNILTIPANRRGHDVLGHHNGPNTETPTCPRTADIP